jgi:antitoxin (DNA-binding transcriptional repressor) of toxin-antitoxin stability system
MQQTSIRELKHETSKVLAMVASGQSVEVRRHKRLVAILSPPRDGTAVEMPDFVARMQGIYGHETLATTGTELVGDARGER